MSAVSKIRAWEIGQEAVCVVGVEGVIEKLENGRIVIGGHDLPVGLGNGVRYVSMDWPEGDETHAYCLRDHCDDHHDEENPQAERLDDLTRLIELEHDRTHVQGPMRFCAFAMCRVADEHLEEARGA